MVEAQRSLTGDEKVTQKRGQEDVATWSEFEGTLSGGGSPEPESWGHLAEEVA